MADHSQGSDNRFLSVFMTIGDIFALNLLWLLASLPIITIGASTTALYTMMIRIVKKEDRAIWGGFWSAFAKNFKQSTICWIIMMIAGAICYAEFFFGVNMTGPLATGYLILSIVEGVVLALTVPFVFPLIACYQNTVWNTIKNSFLLAISNLGAWIKVFLIWFAPTFLTLKWPTIFIYTWYLWAMFAVALMALVSSLVIVKMFGKINRIKDKVEEDKDVDKTLLGEIGLRNDRAEMEKKQEARKKRSIAERAHRSTKDKDIKDTNE